MPPFPRLLTASAFLLAGPLALAQSATTQVQLFGSVAVSAIHGSSNNGGASSNRLLAGPWTPPSLGVQGSEDLGDGFKALFRLEQGVDATDGSRGQTVVAKAKAFDKASWVGVGNGVGTLTLGRQINAGIDRMATTLDLFQASADGRQILSILAINGTNTFGNFDTRIDQSAKLRVNGPMGWNGGISFAQAMADTTTGKSYAIDVGQNTAQYGVGAYYMNYDGAGARTGFSQTTWGLGGNYHFGAVRAYLHYMDAKHDKSVNGATQQHDKVWGLGLSTPLSSAFTLKTAYYLDRSDSVGGLKQSGQRNTAIVMGDYALSKRTTLHAGVYRNGVSGAFGTDPFAKAVNGLVGIAAGSTAATNVAVGISHRF
ncbi:MAG: porin [Burkholderiaceae bacterium]|nr:porin [Burkholderiaceae bacterium]